MRTKRSILNLSTALIGQFFGLIISFISRIIFIKYLNESYLGLNGLFTNILTMLSLVELGVGSAMTFSLYKPLAFDDKEKIKSLMVLYKRAYNIIGIAILLIGICFLPFYHLFLKEDVSIPNLNAIYLLFVLNTGISYFYSYKRSLIICDQKKYITTIYRYVFYFILNVFQIGILVIYKNYILYLICQVIFTWLENIFISMRADKMYPYLKDKNVKNLSKEEIKDIKKNVYAMSIHKIGSVVVNSTDNILISKLVGIVEVGIYSNYFLVTNALETITNQFFNAIVASVGNLGATTSKDKLKDNFNEVFFINYIIFGVCSICFGILINNFIKLWLGEKYIFDINIVLVLTICFYLKGMRRSVLTFRDALGLFWHDRYKALVETLINLVASILLGIKFGVFGIFLGTIVSTLATSMWVEPFILYKYGFTSKVSVYFKKLTMYTMNVIIDFTILYKISNLISYNNMFDFIVKSAIIFTISIVLVILPFCKTKEFKYLTELPSKLKKRA